MKRVDELKKVENGGGGWDDEGDRGRGQRDVVNWGLSVDRPEINEQCSFKRCSLHVVVVW